MKAQRLIDEYGVYFACSICLLDYDRMTEAEKCCAMLVQPDDNFSVGRQPPTKLNKKQSALRSQPLAESFQGRGSKKL
jgi:hypothetical protein